MNQPGWPDPATETSCRHCAMHIRKRRSENGDEQEWVSFVGRQFSVRYVGYDASWFSRFCPREVAEAMGGRRIQHAPIPLNNPEALERWLDR